MKHSMKGNRLPLFPIAIFFFLIFCFSVFGDISENFESCDGYYTDWHLAQTFTGDLPASVNISNYYEFSCKYDFYATSDTSTDNPSLYLKYISDGSDDGIAIRQVGAASLANDILFIPIVNRPLVDFNLTITYACNVSTGDTAQMTLTFYNSSTNTNLGLQSLITEVNCTGGLTDKKTFTKEYSPFHLNNVTYIAFNYHLSTSNAESIWYIYDVSFTGNTTIPYSDIYTSNNLMPDLTINDLKGVYCYNDTNEFSNIYKFYLNMTDDEDDTMYYFSYWNNDLDNTVIVDDFNDPEYVMEENGWAFDASGCGYTTDSSFLELNSSCNNIQMIKWLYAGELSENIDIDFNAWTYYNTTNVYEIWNWHNEKVTGLKLASYIDNYELGPYTNFSYWNGTEYIYFGTSYYFGLFRITYDMNTTTNHICINGLDEPSYYDCNQEVYEELHGTTDNIPGKFYMKPTFNSYFLNIPYVVLDELSYKENPDSIDWEIYTPGDYVEHLFENQGTELLNVYVTDYPNLPDYKEYQFPITVMGDCASVIPGNLSTPSGETIIEDSRNWITESFDNGEQMFNNVFWLCLLIGFIICIIFMQNFEISLIVSGGIGLFISWVMSGNFMQMISTGTLIVLGLAILISKNV